MATFTAGSQYNVYSITDLLDPLSRQEISGGYKVTDSVGNFVDLLGNLSLGVDGNLQGTVNSAAQYFSQDTLYYSIQNRGCPEFCVNGHLAGNCRIDRRHYEQQETRSP